MHLGSSMMVLLAENTGSAPLTISISGNLGAAGGGSHNASEFSSGDLRGYRTTVCAASGDPSVNHLFVIDASLSPQALHTVDASTDSDGDEVSGIGVRSPILYLLYSSQSGGCYTDSEHRAVFDAAAAALAAEAAVAAAEAAAAAAEEAAAAAKAAASAAAAAVAAAELAGSAAFVTGLNTYGRLGDGTHEHPSFTDRLSPVESTLLGMDNLAAAAGTAHTVLLKADGRVVAVGQNSGRFG